MYKISDNYGVIKMKSEIFKHKKIQLDFNWILMYRMLQLRLIRKFSFHIEEIPATYFFEILKQILFD